MRQAAEAWAARAVAERDDILRIGYFGSYARGDWGVGSDLDLVIVVEGSHEPFLSRPSQWDTTGLPVPADLLVYTRSEWGSLDPDSRFAQMLDREVQWLHARED